MSSSLTTVDLLPWREGDAADRHTVAQQLDDALQHAGFVLVTGHGVSADLAAATRKAARQFFDLPRAVKRLYAVGVDGRGWLPTGVEANAFSEGTATPPDLKESLTFGADRPTGDPATDRRWFQPNVWPAEVPEVEQTVRQYLAAVRECADLLMGVCADALGLGHTWFTPSLQHPTYTLNINRYPSTRVVGEPVPGQFRIGPHTDFGTLTLLDREPGAGGLQVYTADDRWVDAPFEPGSLTVNVGDLLARWTGDRWRSARHRVQPPQPDAPEEDLVSLVFFYECDTDALVESMPAPIGHRRYTPVYAADYLDEKYQAIAVDRP
jgi:isopenicillin N synthase-like dioxygenase